MSALAFNAFRPQIQQVMAEDPTDLTRIFSDEVNLVSWQRNADNAIAEYCRTLALTMPIKRIVHVDSDNPISVMPYLMRREKRLFCTILPCSATCSVA